MEYDPSGTFEDRASRIFVNRHLTKPSFGSQINDTSVPNRLLLNPLSLLTSPLGLYTNGVSLDLPVIDRDVALNGPPE